MSLKRSLIPVLATITAIIALGYLSNFGSSDRVEPQVQRECEAQLVRVVKLWRLPPSEIHQLPVEAIRMRTDVTPRGTRVTVQAPPSEPPPYAYAHAETYAPFVLRVRYGWVAQGGRMAFGGGGERLVLSIFGLTRQLSDRSDWYL